MSRGYGSVESVEAFNGEPQFFVDDVEIIDRERPLRKSLFTTLNFGPAVLTRFAVIGISFFLIYGSNLNLTNNAISNFKTKSYANEISNDIVIETESLVYVKGLQVIFYILICFFHYL